ncbi:DUF2207 domain-containing protein [Microbacterium sp.]|uniref:DUF2207 domain-containing protein n=1 Tax=Microbacterium sp. TaxID=51671 RepID=UPI003F9B62A3
MGFRSLVLVSIAAGVLLASPAVAATSVSASAADARTDVNDFDFSSWDATFDVGIDDDGRATMHVEETRVAEFPESDQNRGIVAGYPETYQGASLQTTILSVRDENGDDVPYETEDDDGVLYVLTGNDDYVHGSTTYVIEYEMRDVVLAASSTKVDEFYWDLLPLDSTQDIDSFRAEVQFDDTLAPRLTGSTSCYQGRQGSTDTCTLVSGAGSFAVEAHDLSAGEGITVAIALEPGTVTQPPTRLPNAATDALPYALGGGAVLLSIGGWIAARAMVRSRRRGTGIVVAQYDVPDSLPPLVAHAIIPGARNPVTAEIIHLAVRRLLRIEEVSGEDEKKPHLRRLDGTIPDPVDADALELLFDGTEIGTVTEMPSNNQAFASRMQAMVKTGPAAAAERGLTTKAASPVARVIQGVALAVFAVMLVLTLWGLFTGRESAGPVFFATLISGIVVLISSIASFRKYTVLTREGALQLEYLEGVREFIRVAEADRLQMLQSYSGADRRSDGSVDVIHVYEKLLPFAILFGQEHEWGGVLEYAYGQAQQDPVWIYGATYGFSSRIDTFSSSARASALYSAPSSGSSSSFGGSSGGGFSGGGGGGGFSGGR